jgi:hypothetical protein
VTTDEEALQAINDRAVSALMGDGDEAGDDPYKCPACQVEAMEGGISLQGRVSLPCANGDCRVVAFSPVPYEYLGL